MADKSKLMAFLNSFVNENNEEAELALHEYFKEMMQEKVFEKAKAKDEKDEKEEKEDKKAKKEDEKDSEKDEDKEDEKDEETSEEDDEDDKDDKEEVKEMAQFLKDPNKLEMKKVTPAKDETKASEVHAQNKVDKQKWKKRVPSSLKGTVEKRLVNEEVVEENCSAKHSENEEVKHANGMADKKREALLKKAKAGKKGKKA